VLSQRLVRTLCSHCKEAEMPAGALLASSGLGRFLKAGMPTYRAIGCSHCRDTGYQGRTAIHELLVIDEPMRKAILEGSDESELHALAARTGMLTLYEDGLRKVAAGTTCLEELLRVTQDSQDG
jgi:general secretion pathway protein E